MATISAEEIKNNILKLSIDHQNCTDDEEAEYFEQEAEDLIVAYAESKGYTINGFPTEKKLLPPEALEEDYFCRERYHLYLDRLALDKNDMAMLMWHYVSAFWPDQFESKDDYLQTIKGNVDSGVFYDVTLD